MQDAASSVKRMKGHIQGRLILDADTLRRPRAAPTTSAAPKTAVAKGPRKRAASTVSVAGTE